MIHFLILLVIAGICGSIGQGIAGYSRGGCIVAIAIGFIGALIGMFLSQKLGLPELLDIDGFPVIWSIAGSALFVAVISFFSRRGGA